MVDLSAVAALPDVLLRPTAFPTDRAPRLVATGYGGSVRSSFSGTTAYLAEAGIADGSLDGAFTLFSTSAPDRALQVRGALWKARRVLARKQSGGFKFSGQFSAHLWHRYLPDLAGTDLISTFQLYSDEFFDERARHGVGAFFYLDGTLHDYLRGYREYDVAAVDSSTADDAIEIEARGYQRADGIAVMSEFAASTLVTRYSVPRERIEVIAPGANLSDEMASQVIAARRARTPSTEFTVGFVGLYPGRKGLPKLAAAISALRRDKVAVRLCVVGNCPADIAAMDGVDALGPISKADDPQRFVEALSRIDLGCQLSTVELFGIAVLEFLRCGIPFLATEVGGITDIVLGGGGIGVAADVEAGGVAEAIRAVVNDESLRSRLDEAAGERAHQVRWQQTAARLGELLVAAR